MLYIANYPGNGKNQHFGIGILLSKYFLNFKLCPIYIERYICDKCGKGFSKKQKTQFDEHVSQNLCHQQDKLIKCDICDETFTGQQYLTQHFRYIHGSLPPNVTDKGKLELLRRCAFGDKRKFCPQEGACEIPVPK